MRILDSPCSSVKLRGKHKYPGIRNLGPGKIRDNLGRSGEKQGKSAKIRVNLRTSAKIRENLRKSAKIREKTEIICQDLRRSWILQYCFLHDLAKFNAVLSKKSKNL